MVTSKLKNTVLVVFGKDFPAGHILRQKFNVIVANKMFQKDVEYLGCRFIELETLVGPGSVYEASTFLEELSLLTLPNGSRLTKSFFYKGYELWWIHYNSLFHYFCLPYTQYRKLLEYLKGFQGISFYRPPYKDLFFYYLQVYGCKVAVLRESSFKSPTFLPFGIFLQIVITFLCLPILMVRKHRLVLFTGDKFEKLKDYDFRMGFIYEELKQRDIPFVEFIRSLESWKTVLKHAIKRRRPVIYSEAVSFAGRFASILSGGRRCAKRRFDSHAFDSVINPEERFKLLIATKHLLGVYDDIWAIRIMKWILRSTGVRVALVPSVSERNIHAVLGCKLNDISTVGILHGVASRYANPYDFMSGFDGEKMFSVDVYGVWSEWWKEHYIKNSQAYKPEQLYVSGPMRPLEVQKESNIATGTQGEFITVLFIAEQTAAPSEVMPYLHKLLDRRDIKLTIKFRPGSDGFEKWLLQNEPQVLKLQHVQIIKGGMQEAIQNADVVVGCHSTGVLEALLQLKVPVFLRTQKWGDYYSMIEYSGGRRFFAENPVELIERIKGVYAISPDDIIDLREQYFGDPHKNGSKWVVDEIEQFLKRV